MSLKRPAEEEAAETPPAPKRRRIIIKQQPEDEAAPVLFPELWRIILSYLPLLSDFNRMLRVHRYFALHLYSLMTVLRPERYDKAVPLKNHTGYFRMQKKYQSLTFLRLAKFIHLTSLSIGENYVPCHKWPLFSWYNDDVLRKVKTVRKIVTWPNMDTFQCGPGNALCTRFLFLMPNLTSLDIDTISRKTRYSKAVSFRNLAHKLPLLKRLVIRDCEACVLFFHGFERLTCLNYMELHFRFRGYRQDAVTPSYISAWGITASSQSVTQRHIRLVQRGVYPPDLGYRYKDLRKPIILFETRPN